MIRYLISLLFVFLSFTAFGHESSLAYLEIGTDGQSFTGRLDVPVADLNSVLAFDTNSDRKLTWAEFERRQNDLVAYVGEHLQFSTAHQHCETQMQSVGLADRGVRTYTVIEFYGGCSGEMSGFSVDYRLLHNVDAGHKLLVIADQQMIVLSDRRPSATLGEPSVPQQMTHFVVEGLFHITGGFDHLAFVGLLILPIVLGRAREQVVSKAIWRITKVVTAFTIGHSVTLALTLLQVVRLPSLLVEAVIAASIVVAASLNLLPRMPHIGAALGLVFGLIHGMGFASALDEIVGGFSITALVGFNIGIELGQLAFVCAVLPVLILVRRSRFPEQVALTLPSVALGALGAFWLVERVQ